MLKPSIEWANDHWKKYGNMEFCIGDAHRLKFKTGIFSAVFALEVLEHVYNPSSVLMEIKRILKKRRLCSFFGTDGQFFIQKHLVFLASFLPARMGMERYTHSDIQK